MPLRVQLVADCDNSPCMCGACLAAAQAYDAGNHRAWIGGGNVIVFEAQISHSLSHMAGAAGLYIPIWRPHFLDIQKAQQLIHALTAGWQLLVKDMNRFKGYDLLGGICIEDYVDLKHFVCRYLRACERTPQAAIEVSG